MMQSWFPDAKFGVFVHWGIYAVGRRGGESWPLARAKCSHEEYMQQMEGFDASAYDPREWATLFKECGARYAVLTTKHHDGVTLWPTKTDSPSIPKEKSCGDLVGSYLAAMRGAGLKTGLYFSHTDWSHLEHMEVLTGRSREELLELRKQAVELAAMWGDGKTLEDDPKDERVLKWEAFLDFHRAQLGELLGNYGPIDLIWFDVMMGEDRFDYRCSELRDFIHTKSPTTVINSRLGTQGDYETPEQFIPVHAPVGPWELCMTTNNSWSFTGDEKEYKTPFELLTMFCECLGMGGNLLLNVGPDEHGVIPEQQVALLKTMGAWISRHEEAVHGTRRGLPYGYAYHHTSMNEEGDLIYVYLAHVPKESTSIKGIHNEIKKISLLGSGVECSHKRIGGAPWLNVPGTLWIDLPKDGLEAEVSVLKIELEGALELHDGRGVEIDAN